MILSWKDCTVGKYVEFINIWSEYDHDALLNSDTANEFNDRIFTLFTGIEDVGAMNYEEYKKINAKLRVMINIQPTPNDIKKVYTLNGIRYDITRVVPNLQKISVSDMRAIQFIDSLTTRSTIKDVCTFYNKLAQSIAIVVVPNGQDYGVEPFSLSENMERINNHMKIGDALALSAFFLMYLNTLRKSLKTSLENQAIKGSRKLTKAIRLDRQ